MWNSRFAGQWTYRSLINTPELVDDFNKVKFGEGVLTLNEFAQGLVSGTFNFGDDYQLDVIGSVANDHIRLRSNGRAKTPTEGWVYEHEGRLAPQWSNANLQRLAIVGSVIRTAPHDDRPAGLVGSFIAVATAPVPLRGIDPLPWSVRELLGIAHMRLHHTAWHATRNAWEQLNAATQKAIADLAWAPPRPSLEFTPRGQRKRPITWTGAGEDFLFMHREMLNTFRDAMRKAGVVDWQPWTSIPSPGAAPSVPTAWDNGDEEDSRRFAALKTDEFYWSRMRWWDDRFKDPAYLRTVSLGELGSQMEWSVHNDMHMRWSALPRDPVTMAPVPAGRAADDFDPKWDLPGNDDLADFYASHVNPIFYKLHGWIDDRVEDWASAHEKVDPGSVQRRDVGGTAWFQPGKWVQVETPWSAPPSHQHGGGHDHGQPKEGSDPMDDEVIRKVIRLVSHPLEMEHRGGFVPGSTRNWARVGA